MRSVLAVVCPPAAVLASSGSRAEAAANTALTLLFFVPGVVHALGVVDRYTTGRQYDSVMRAMEQSGV